MSIEKRAWFSAEEIIQKYWEHKEKNMEKKDKPRLAEVLGVEVGEKFTITYEDEIPVESVHFFVNDDGHFLFAGSGSHGSCVYGAASLLCNAINHPESIIRTPRLSEPELAICKALGAKWVELRKGEFEYQVSLWLENPKNTTCLAERNAIWRGHVRSELFPSVHPGDLIEVP